MKRKTKSKKKKHFNKHNGCIELRDSGYANLCRHKQAAEAKSIGHQRALERYVVFVLKLFIGPLSIDHIHAKLTTITHTHTHRRIVLIQFQFDQDLID